MSGEDEYKVKLTTVADTKGAEEVTAAIEKSGEAAKTASSNTQAESGALRTVADFEARIKDIEEGRLIVGSKTLERLKEQLDRTRELESAQKGVADAAERTAGAQKQVTVDVAAQAPSAKEVAAARREEAAAQREVAQEGKQLLEHATLAAAAIYGVVNALQKWREEQKQILEGQLAIVESAGKLSDEIQKQFAASDTVEKKDQSRLGVLEQILQKTIAIQKITDPATRSALQNDIDRDQQLADNDPGQEKTVADELEANATKLKFQTAAVAAAEKKKSDLLNRAPLDIPVDASTAQSYENETNARKKENQLAADQLAIEKAALALLTEQGKQIEAKIALRKKERDISMENISDSDTANLDPAEKRRLRNAVKQQMGAADDARANQQKEVAAAKKSAAAAAKDQASADKAAAANVAHQNRAYESAPDDAKANYLVNQADRVANEIQPGSDVSRAAKSNLKTALNDAKKDGVISPSELADISKLMEEASQHLTRRDGDAEKIKTEITTLHRAVETLARQLANKG